MLCGGTAAPAGHRAAGDAGTRAQRSIPILEYHAIGFRAAGSPLEGLWLTPAELRRQVDWLASHGWHSVTLGQAAAYWRGAVPLAGYEVAETENYGRASPADGLLTLDRLRVTPGLSPRAFAALLG